MAFTVARLKGRSWPETRQRPYASGSTFLKGALLVLNGSGEWAECAADPTSIGAVALHGVGTDTSGFGGHGYKEFPQGYAIGALVQDEVKFLANYTGTLPAADGGSYGVVAVSGDWKVDFSDTTNVCVKLVGRRTTSPENLGLVEVVFLASDVQAL